jgi:ZIP family zinc transporter/zinc and cadmium transporter
MGGSKARVRDVITPLLYALVAAAGNVIGGLLITTASPRGILAQGRLLGFGAGFMLAVALLAMVPEALAPGNWGAVWVLAGYLLVHVTQHVLTPHFHFGEETHHEAMVDEWVGTAALLGLLLHTFFDGVAIASAFDVGIGLGVLVFLAVLVHKVPEGVTVASIMLVSGNTKRKALLAVGLLGLSTVVGVLLTAWLAPLARHGLALSAGVTLYVAASNLMPEVQKEKEVGSGIAAFLGVALYLVARLLLGFEG